MSNRANYLLYIGPVATWLRSCLISMTGDYREEEIDYGECLDLVRETFVQYIYNVNSHENPIQTDFEQYNLPPEIYANLYQLLLKAYEGLVANTVRYIDPAEYIEINWTSPDSGIISQTTNRAYENDRIHNSTVEFTAHDLENRFL